MKTRWLPVKYFLYGFLLVIHMAKPGGSSCSSGDVETDFREPSNAVTVSSVIGIPDREQVEIRCECMGGRRPGTPDWTYNDRTVSDGPHNNDEPYVDSDATLRVDSFSEDSSGLYTCLGNNRNMEFNLIWYDPDERPQLVVEPKRQNVMIRNGNERVTLECIAFGADITWERRDGKIPKKAMLREGDTRLEIPNVRRNDGDDYRCVAENRDGQTMSKYAAVTITEELEIVTDPADVSQRIGKTATLTCSSEGFQSENFTYFWTNSSGYPVYRENSSSGISNLVIPAVGPRNSGEYRCTVQNEWGQQVTSRSASVQVEIPESFPPMNMPSGTIDQFSATLNWELSTVDVDLVDRIMIRTQQVSLLTYRSGMGSGKRQIAGNTATVTITDPTATQYTFNNLQPFSQYCFTVTAMYAFEGQTLGEVEAQPFCTNTSEAAPSAPQDVTVLSQGFTTITLTWTTPQSPNGIILNYTIKYNDKVKVVPVEDAMTTFILSQLLEGTDYAISISATNSAGNGIFSNIITTSTLSKAPTGNAEQLLFQIKLESDQIQFCPTWISDNRRRLIVSAVVDLIQMECDCVLEQEEIDQDHLLCDQSQPNRTVLRAKITTYQLTRNDLLIILQNMITGGKLMINESTAFRLDGSCPVEIASFNDPLCIMPATISVNQEMVSNKSGSPTGAIVGSTIAILIIITMMILGILLILYWRNKHRKLRTETDPGEVRYNNQTTSMLQAVPQTMPYSSPLPLVSVDNNLQKDCANGSNECLIPDKRKMKNTDFPIPYVDFDDNNALKSIINIAQVKIQPNPSYFKTNIPDDNSTEV